MNANGKRAPPPDPWADWRGERRSTRLGAPLDVQVDAPSVTKRARTEESTVSTNSLDRHTPADAQGAVGELKVKVNGAAAVKPTETVVEQIAGKKKSKFWVYAVEPVPNKALPAGINGDESSQINGHTDMGDSKHSPQPLQSPPSVDVA